MACVVFDHRFSFNVEAECNDIDPLINGRIIGNRTYGNVVTYQCDVGYMLQGNPRRQCRSDRLWSGTAPTCAPTGNLLNNIQRNSYDTYKKLPTFCVDLFSLKLSEVNLSDLIIRLPLSN